MAQTTAEKMANLPQSTMAEEVALQAVSSGTYQGDLITVYVFEDKSQLEINFLTGSVTVMDRLAVWLWTQRSVLNLENFQIMDGLLNGELQIPSWLGHREKIPGTTLLWDLDADTSPEDASCLSVFDDREELCLDDLDIRFDVGPLALFDEISLAIIAHGVWESGNMGPEEVEAGFGWSVDGYCMDSEDLFSVKIQDGFFNIYLMDSEPRFLQRLEIKCAPYAGLLWNGFARVMIIAAAKAALASDEEPAPIVVFSSFYDVVKQVQALYSPEPPLFGAWVKTLVLRRFVFGDTEYIVWQQLEEHGWQVLEEKIFITLTGGNSWLFHSHTKKD
jgi:hypothetical protein